jgi:hypothetical protein
MRWNDFSISHRLVENSEIFLSGVPSVRCQRKAAAEPAAVADIAALDLSPRSFRTRVRGLFLFVPPMKQIDLMAGKIGRECDRAQAKKIFRNLLDVSATVEVGERQVVVTLDKRAHNPYLIASGLADIPTRMPWFGNKQLGIRFA